MPVLIIPVVWILYKQRTTLRGILGAAVTLIGVSILFLTYPDLFSNVCDRRRCGTLEVPKAKRQPCLLLYLREE